MYNFVYIFFSKYTIRYFVFILEGFYIYLMLMLFSGLEEKFFRLRWDCVEIKVLRYYDYRLKWVWIRKSWRVFVWCPSFERERAVLCEFLLKLLSLSLPYLKLYSRGSIGVGTTPLSFVIIHKKYKGEV